MRTIDRYLGKEIGGPFFVSMGLFFVVVAFAQLLKISDAVTGLGITSQEVLQSFIFSLPPIMGLLIPVSFLFATLLGIGRIAADRELIAFLSTGMSPYRFLLIPILYGCLLAIFCGLILSFGEPWGVKGLRKLMAQSAQRALASGVRAGEFHEWIKGVTFYAAEQKQEELYNVVFADRRDDEHAMVISARRGAVVSGTRTQDLVFDLKDGVAVVHSADLSTIRLMNFQSSRYRLDVGKLVRKKARTMSAAQEKSLSELWHYSRDKSKPLNRRALMTIIFYRKIALPLATLIFGLMAVPLAFNATGGATRARSFLYSAGVVGIYYYVGRAFELAARRGQFDPVLAAWIPNLIGLSVLFILLLRMRRSRL